MASVKCQVLDLVGHRCRFVARGFVHGIYPFRIPNLNGILRSQNGGCHAFFRNFSHTARAERGG